MPTDTWIAGAVEALAGGANVSAITGAESPRQKIGRAKSPTKSTLASRAQTNSGGQISDGNHTHCAPRSETGAAKGDLKTNSALPSLTNSAVPDCERDPFDSRAADTELSGHIRGESQFRRAAQPHSTSPYPPCKPPGERDAEPYSSGPCAADIPSARATGSPPVDGHRPDVTLNGTAIDDPHSSVGHTVDENHRAIADAGAVISQIVENWRRRMDMLRARQRLDLQAQSVCRRIVDGDKAKAAKLWAQVKKDPAHELRGWLNPYLMAMAPLDAAKLDLEKLLAKLVRDLPIYPWAKSVLGFGDVSLAGVIGECRIGPGEYRTVSALWKRMGMAVVNGERQRRIAGSEALEHGYNAERRSLMWNIGGTLMKAQLRSEKDGEGAKVEGSEYSLGELGQVYLDRKAYLRERDPDRSKPHIHNDAKRYMEKRLLRQLWQEWRRAIGISESRPPTPAVDLREAA